MRVTARLVPLLLCMTALPLRAEVPARPAQGAVAERPDLAQTVPPHPLPPDISTDHVIDLPGRTLKFKATAGAVRLADATSGAPLADIAFVAYRLDDAGDAGRRPLTVVLNGGPGAASAWLDLGAIGPWRLPIPAGDLSPSMPTAVVDNADTWLDFTDLLFVDPLGTGYSRALGKGDDVGKAFYSVDGDIGALATVVRKWLVANNRLGSPHFILGESYGGFRAPKLARKLEESEGVGIAGIAMLSPVLDFGWFGGNDPAVVAAHFPSLVAAAKGIRGPRPREKLGAAESYAAGPYLVDLFQRRRDAAALRRMSTTVAGFLGIDEGFVARLGGRVSAEVLTREKLRASGRIASAYDAGATGWDPTPFDNGGGHRGDPVLDALKTPFAAAMAEVTAVKLKWPVQARYEILNLDVNRRWDWDNGRRPPEAMSDLAALLALDPRFRALVMHGASDEVTPYFASKMLIDQLPAYGDPSRIGLAVYGGGHMPYLDDGSRAAMREDGRKLIAGEPPR